MTPRSEPGSHVSAGAGALARPELCVGAAIEHAGHLLLIKRGRPPAAGRWSLPGGRVEGGELLTEAVVREVREETGLDCVCGPLLGWVERLLDGGHYVVLDFGATVTGFGCPEAGDDASEVAWVPLGDVARWDLVDGLADFLVGHGVLDGTGR